ncbi:MAG: EamA family transporter [Burkholderiaceae bacterium]
MALTWPVVLAVLFGAVLHALWNTLVKSSGDKEVDTALLHFLGAIVALPLLFFGLPPVVALPYIAASIVIHVAYYITLAGAYKHGDLGLTYPIMRGSAPLLVALGSSAVLGESLSPLAWAGVLGVTLGVAMVGLARHVPQAHGLRQAADSPQGLSASGFSPGEALHHRRALAFALANACVIATYTFVDGSGVRATVAAGDTALSYVILLFVLDGIPYPALVMLKRDAAGRRAIVAYARHRWPLAVLGGAASIGSYAIALWAMTRAPVAAVSALRETSVLFATVLGVWLLNERFGVQRATGTVVIVAGVVALRFG